MTDIDWNNEEARQQEIQKIVEQEVGGLKNKNKELLGKLNKFKDYEDIDPDEYRNLKSEKEKLEEERLRKEGEFEKLFEKEKSNWQKQLTTKDEYSNKLKNTVEQLLRDNKLQEAISKHEGNVKLLAPHMRDRVKVVEKDNRFDVEIVDDKGQPLLDSKGNPATFDDLVNEFKNNEDFKVAFAGPKSSGSGQFNAVNIGGNAKKFSEMTLTEKTTLKKTNPDLYAKLAN